VLRTIEQGHKWSEEYPFDRKQKAAAQALREAIDVEEVDDDTVKEAIHGLGLALFCKKRRSIGKGDFACPVYRFLVISSIKEGGSFMQESDITNIIAKLQWTCRAMIYEEMLRLMEMMTEKKSVEEIGKVCQGRSVHGVQFDSTGVASSVGDRVWHEWNATNRMAR